MWLLSVYSCQFHLWAMAGPGTEQNRSNRGSSGSSDQPAGQERSGPVGSHWDRALYILWPVLTDIVYTLENDEIKSSFHCLYEITLNKEPIKIPYLTWNLRTKFTQ